MIGIAEKLREFMENEARSCSMDFGSITPEYVYRMWGGKVSMVDIEHVLAELRKQGALMIKEKSNG